MGDQSADSADCTDPCWLEPGPRPELCLEQPWTCFGRGMGLAVLALCLCEARQARRAAVQPAARPCRRCRRSRSRRFPTMRARRLQAALEAARQRPDRCGWRPARWASRCRRGSSGRARTPPTCARRLWRRDAADWWYLDGVVLQRLVRARRGRRCASRAPRSALAGAADGPQARLGRGAVRRRAMLEASAAAYDGAGRRSQPRRRSRRWGADAWPPAPAGTPRRWRSSSAPSRCFRSSARPTTGWRSRCGRWDARDEARAALEQHRVYGTRWPAIDDPLLARVARCATTRAGTCLAGLRQAELGDLAGAIEAHEAALARNPSLAQAHANLISLYGRAGQWAQGRSALQGACWPSATTSTRRTTTTACCSACSAAGPRRPRPIALAIAGQPAARAWRATTSGRCSRASASVAEAMDQYRQAVAADPQLRLARYNLGRMLLAARQIDAAAAEFEQAARAAGRRVAALSSTRWPSPTCRPGGGNTGVHAGAARRGSWPSASDSSDLVAAIDRDLAGLK